MTINQRHNDIQFRLPKSDFHNPTLLISSITVSMTKLVWSSKWVMKTKL